MKNSATTATIDESVPTATKPKPLLYAASLEPKRNATLQDVAKLAGATKASVSVVLNGSRSSTGVSASTRERILQAARELQYTPNSVAQSLSRGRTDIISFYSGQGYLDLRNQFIAALIAGLHEGCEQFQKDLLLHGTFHGAASHDIYSALVGGKIDGLIFHTPFDNPLVELLVKARLPVVAVADGVPQLPSVVADLTGGARLIAEHLRARGHRRVMLRTCPLAYMNHPLSSVVARQEAFHRAAQTLEMQVVDVEAPDEYATPDQCNALTRTEVKILQQVKSKRPTAVVCWTDNAAQWFWEGCQNEELRVPHDIAIAGLDGLRTGGDNYPRLTGLKVPWVEIARLAVEILMWQIDGKDVPHETVLPVELVIGNTT